MAFVERPCRLFQKPGPKNTEAVLEAVAKRLEEGNIKWVIIASTSGETGARFADALRGKANVVVISHEKMKVKYKKEIEDLEGIAVDETHLPLHRRGMDKIRNAFYMLGQGFKVAVEVILIAVDKEVIKPGQDVIGVGGTGRGADTAIVAKATATKDILSDNIGDRLEIREIIAMPVKKKWWE
ncbi:MAG: hypothetical protein NZ918_02520 [Aigarchaeota archaeon]|nr:hypothetical protein [Aigarchaeota archaeon]